MFPVALVEHSYFLDLQVQKGEGSASLILSSLKLMPESNSQTAGDSECVKSRVIKVALLSNSQNPKRRRLGLLENSAAFVIEEDAAKAKSIVGNFLRRLYGQSRLSDRIEIVDLATENLDRCSVRIF